MTAKWLRLCLIGCSVAVITAFTFKLATNRLNTRPYADRPDNDLSPGVWAVLDHADHYELLSVDPRSPSRRLSTQPTTAPSTREDSVDGFTVFGGVTIDDANERAEVNAALRSSLREWQGSASACFFQPRHAIRATRGDSHAEVLICFHCGDVEESLDGKAQGRAYLYQETPAIIVDLLEAAKVHVDGEDEP